MRDEMQRGEEYEASKPVASRQELPQATSYRYVGRNQQPHLPECMESVQPGYYECICPALRACEARGWDRGEREGFGHGLSAAREAVAGLPTQYAMEPRHVALALAAIDALKEKP